MSWTAYIGFTVSEYYIYRGPALNAVTLIDSVPGTTLNYTDHSAPHSSIYLIKAVNPNGPCIPTTIIRTRNGEKQGPYGSFSNSVSVICTGVQDITDNNNNINIYPNPAHNATTININTTGLHYLELDDITGRKLTRMEFNGRQMELNTTGLAQGIYFVKICDSQNKVTSVGKIVVQ